MWMLSEGVATAEGLTGPLELGDLTGWDTRLSTLKYLHEKLAEKFRPCPPITNMVQAGRAMARRSATEFTSTRTGRRCQIPV